MEGFPYNIAPADQDILDVRGPLLADGWAKMLYRHPDRLFPALICNIILRGAKLG